MYRILFICLLMTGVSHAQNHFTIKVVDQFSMPVPQALILIGMEKDVPFTNNLLTADAGGIVQTPEAWITQEPMTIDAPGYIRQTVMNQTASDIIIRLNPSPINPPLFISGQVKDLPVVNKDKLIDFALVLTSFSQNDFVHINQEQFISPYIDNLSILGQVVPVFSNASLPEQKEAYLVPVPLTVAKATYTKFLSSVGDKKIISMSGQFPFKSVVDDLKAGKSFFDVINYFDIFSLGSLNINLSKSTTNNHFSGVTVQLDRKMTLTAPVVSNEEQVLILPMNAVSNYFLPSGIKKFNSAESAQFNTLDTSSVSMLAMVKKTPEFSSSNEKRRLSALFVKPTDATANLYLPLIDDPVTQSLYPVSVSTNTLVAPNGLYPAGTMAVLSELSDSVYNQQVVKVAHAQWEIYSSNWEHHIQLPKWPLDMTAAPMAVIKSFEVTYFAQGQTPLNNDVKSMLDQATHLTKSVVNLQY